MKKTIAILMTALFFALPVTASESSPLAYDVTTTNGGSTVYLFEDLILQIPADWTNKYTLIDEEGRFSLYQTGSYEKYQEQGYEGGFLFSLGASVNDSYKEIPNYKYLGFSERSMMNYYLVLPSDVQAYIEDETITAEYQQMFTQIDDIVSNAIIYPAEGGSGATA